MNDSYDKNQLNAMRIHREKVVMEVEKKQFLPIFFRKSEILRQKTSKYDSKLVILRTNSTGRKSSPDL